MCWLFCLLLSFSARFLSCTQSDYLFLSIAAKRRRKEGEERERERRESVADFQNKIEKTSSSTAAASASVSGKENGATATAATAAAPAAPAPAPPPKQQQQLTPLDDAAAVMRGLSVIQPWGSFDAAFFPKDKLVLRSAQKAGGASSSSTANVKEVVVPISSIRAVAVLDAVPEEQAAFVLLGLKPAVSLPWVSAAAAASGGDSLECLALRIPNSAPAESLSFAGNPTTPIQGPRAVVLCAALGKSGVAPNAFLSPDPSVFANAAASANGGGGTGGGCSVRAAVKASQGHLFPLGDRAIAFVKKPAFLVSLKALSAAELARAGGGSASFDLLLHLKASSNASSSSGGEKANNETRVIEFGQIPRQELAPLRKWFEDRRVPLGASAEEGAGGGRKKKASAEEEEEEEEREEEDEESSSDDDDEDEDFDPKAAAAELKAQEEAEKAEDEEEEDDDEQEAGESSSDDDDDDDKDRPKKKSRF